MNLQTGNPTMDGLYVVFVPAIFKEWLEPQIVAWHDGAWHHRWSKQKYQDDVQSWIGPMPVMKANAIDTKPKPPTPEIFSQPEPPPLPMVPPIPEPQELPCEHDNMVLQHTGDGTPVNFCPDCGVNFIITGNRLDYDL